MSELDKTVINLKVSKSLKRDAQALADELGLPLTTIITVNLKEFVRNRSLSISAFPRLKPTIEAELGLAIEDYRNNRNISKTYRTPDEVAAHLSAL